MAKGAAADGDGHDRSINEEGYAKLDNLSTGANRESPLFKLFQEMVEWTSYHVWKKFRSREGKQGTFYWRA